MGDNELSLILCMNYLKRKKNGNKTSKYSKSLAKACGVYLTDYFSNLALYILQQQFLP